MKEYIERESTYEDFEKCNSKNPKWTPIRVKTLIARQKAADVAPVRHGRWLSWDELHGGNTPAKNVLGVFCSECKRQSDSKTQFCANCGAIMDGGHDG